MTSGYRGLEGVRRGSMEIQEVSGGYRSYMRLKKVAKGYRWLEQVT